MKVKFYCLVLLFRYPVTLLTFSLFLVILLVVNVPTTEAQSQYLIPGDEDYYTYTTPQTDYIFSKDSFPLLEKTIFYTKIFHQHYSKSFQWNLDDQSFLVLSSKKNQIPNALATVFPYNQNVLYRGGPHLLESFASSSWLFTLLAHETNHLYQMNPKVGLGEFTSDVFGKVPFFLYPIIPLPVFPHPNFLLPSWILEGNAVLNESLFGAGGRLYSGEERALFYALLKDEALSENRLTNNHLEFPYGHEKYIVGGYFNLFLSLQYGVDRTNQYFLRHASHYFNPLILNSTFSDHFGETYSDLVKEFLSHYSHQAKEQKSSSESPLVTTQFHYPMNADGEKIYFMYTEDGKTDYQIFILDKKSLKVQKKISLAPPGKLFELKQKNKFFSATSDKLRQKEYVFGLWGDDKDFLPQYHSKIMLDKRGENELYLDATQSFDQPQLYLNGDFVGTIHSTALFGSQKEFYFFKQQGEERVLYQVRRNDQLKKFDWTPLFSLKNFYAKLVDVDHQQNIYFISSTPYGSTLFQFDPGKKKIFRVSPSDTIVDARKIKEQQFLITEISSTSYDVKIISASSPPLAEEPHFYAYSFEKDKAYKTFSAYAESNKEDQNREELKSAVEKYHYFNYLKIASWRFDSRFGEEGRTSANLNLQDPLQFNQLSFFAESFHSQKQKLIEVLYQNHRELLDWSLKVHWVVERRDPFPKIPRSDDYSFLQGGLHFPFTEWFRWNPYVGTHLILSRDQYNPLESYSYAGTKRNYFYPVSFTSFDFTLLHSEFLVNKRGIKNSYIAQFSRDIKDENFLTFDSILHYSSTGELFLGETLKETSLIEQLPVIRQNLYGKSILGGRLGFSYKKVLNQLYSYSPRFPLSLRRAAPRLFTNFLYYQKKNSSGGISESDVLTDLGIGIQNEVLLAHLIPLKINIDFIRRLEPKKTEGRVSLLMQESF